MQEIIEKLNKEFKDYIEDIRRKDDIEIAINSAYEIVVKQEILDLFECGEIWRDEEQRKSMLQEPNLLEYLYQEWLDCDSNMRESIYYSVASAIDKIK